MGLFNHFPYPDTHQLNLDWILDAVKSCVDMVTELWTYVKEPGTGIQKAYVEQVQAMMGKLYPVGAVYVNFRNQAMPEESDTKVIERLQALTGGTWARAGSHGQPVTATGQLGWTSINLGNAAGDAQDTNFNIYVRTA